MSSSKISHYFLLLAAYLFLLAWNGYTFGHGDTIEVFPYSKWLNDNSLYPHDFYIQHIVQHIPNERIILAKLFSWTGNAMEWVAFILHFLCAVFFLEGLFRIGEKFIQSEGLIWMAILLPISLFYGKNLGGNEMYIPFVTSGTLAKVLVIWAVLFFLDKKINYVYILLAIATFVQPIVSIQLFVLVTGVLFLEKLFFKKVGEENDFRKYIFPIAGYLLTAGVWVFLMNKNFASGEIDKSLLFEFFEFRVPHHYYPSYFPLKYYLLLIPLFVFGLFFYLKKEKRLFLFFALALLGMVVFWLGVEVFQIPSILAAQWFKTTIWLKAFSFIAVTAWVESLAKRFSFSIFQDKRFNVLAKSGLGMMGLVSIYIMIQPFSISCPLADRFQKRNYDFPFFKIESAEINIAEQAKDKTPKDAVFIIPISNTHFKHYSERSTYIDYKAVIHRKSIIPVWYQRVKEVYGVDIQSRRSGNIINDQANDFYKNRSVQDLKAFSKKGIQYWMTFSDVDLPLEVVAQNEKYIIYRIGD